MNQSTLRCTSNTTCNCPCPFSPPVLVSASVVTCRLGCVRADRVAPLPLIARDTRVHGSDWVGPGRVGGEQGADGGWLGGLCASSQHLCIPSTRPSRTRRIAVSGRGGRVGRALPSHNARCLAVCDGLTCVDSSSPYCCGVQLAYSLVVGNRWERIVQPRAKLGRHL